MEKIKVLIAEDHPLMRDTIVSHLSEPDTGIEVIGHCGNGSDLIELLKFNKKNRPHVVILDVDMPVMNGIEALEIIKQTYNDEIKVLIFSRHETIFSNMRLIQLGADGIINKKSAIDELINAVHSVYEGMVVYQNAKAHKKIVDSKKENTKPVDEFTELEIKILWLICDQKSAKEIADELGISVNTVGKYRTELMRITQSKNMAGMITFAVRNGIYDVDDNS
jgi:two-component system, NarL family, response regulator DegU